MDNKYISETVWAAFASSNTITINRLLAHAIGKDTTLLWQTLLSKEEYYRSHDMLTSDGFFYSTVDDLWESTTLSKHQQAQAVKELIEIGLLETATRGIPAKRYFHLLPNEEVLQCLLEKGLEISKSKRKPQFHQESNFLTSSSKEIEQQDENKQKQPSSPQFHQKLKNLTSCSKEIEQQEVEIFDDKHSNNLTTCSKEIEQQEVKKLDRKHNNKTIIKKLYNNQSINQSKEIDGQIDINENQLDLFSAEFKAEQLKQQIRENIEYDHYMTENYPDYVKTYITEIYKIICDVMCIPHKSFKLNKAEYPCEVVRNAFLQLTSSHIEYVRDQMSKNTTKITNMRGYLIAALYNAVMTIDHHYEAEVRSDMYGYGGVESV